MGSNMREFGANSAPDMPVDHQLSTSFTFVVTRAIPLFVLLLLSACLPYQPDKKAPRLLVSTSQPRYTDFVDPFIGTDGNGKTYPGASVPLAWQLSPTMVIMATIGTQATLSRQRNSRIQPHSQRGQQQFQQYFVHAAHAALHTAKLDQSRNKPSIVSHFSHDNQTATPGHYQVYLQDYQINVELTAGLRSGVHAIATVSPKAR